MPEEKSHNVDVKKLTKEIYFNFIIQIFYGKTFKVFNAPFLGDYLGGGKDVGAKHCHR